MSISKKFIAAAIVVAGLGIASGADAASSDLKVEPRTSQATTCEGDLSCGVLGRVCDAVGGTFNSHHSNDKGHGHAHGICTWPWE